MKDEIIEAAFQAMEHAYAPYSKYHVGAVVKCFDGTLFYGANVENASYGLTCCAERNAVFSAYSNGKRKEDIEALAIVSDGATLAYPCGACRQVLVELMDKHTPIYLSNKKVEKTVNIEQLMPLSFTSEDIRNV